LCESLETEFSRVVNTNAYITPGNTSGFTPHYDTHEVFVLQIAGHKHWRLYASPLSLSHPNQLCTPQAMVGLEHTLALTLHRGDLLYLPRGTVHAAQTTDSFSAHVTIGVTMYTAVELLQDLLHEAMQIPALRASLPRGFATRGECQPALRERLLHALDTLRAEMDPTALVERFTARVRVSHRKVPERFNLDVNVIGPHTRLRAARQHLPLARNLARRSLARICKPAPLVPGPAPSRVSSPART
jgi:ribosomal protein L16 Arg81 hydroxylase